MAMLTIRKLMGFLMVFVLKTIIPMTVFPASATRKIRQKAKVVPIFPAVGFQEQLDGCVPFIVLFKSCDIVVQFLVFRSSAHE